MVITCKIILAFIGLLFAMWLAVFIIAFWPW